MTHPELQATFYLDILGVKKNPQSTMYTQLGVLTKGTVIEVNVSDLGLVTTSGKVVWGKFAQVTNNPELDGCQRCAIGVNDCMTRIVPCLFYNPHYTSNSHQSIPIAFSRVSCSH